MVNNSTHFDPMQIERDTIIGSVVAVIFSISFIENIFVVLVIVMKLNPINRPIHSLLLSLSTADLFKSFASHLPYAIHRLEHTWTMGAIVCKINIIARGMFADAAIFTIALLGLERFRSLEKTDGVAFSIRTTRIMIVAVWIVCLAAALPQVMWFQVVTYPGGTNVCMYTGYYASLVNVYTIVNRICFFLVPMVTTWFCYMGVIHRMLKSSRKVEHLQVHATAKTKRQQTVIRVSRTCIIIAVAFTLCWTPFNVCLLYSIINSDRAAVAMLQYFWLPASFASCINPLIYGLTWKSFREAAIQFFKCRPVRQMDNTTNTIS